MLIFISAAPTSFVMLFVLRSAATPLRNERTASATVHPGHGQQQQQQQLAMQQLHDGQLKVVLQQNGGADHSNLLPSPQPQSQHRAQPGRHNHSDSESPMLHSPVSPPLVGEHNKQRSTTPAWPSQSTRG